LNSQLKEFKLKGVSTMAKQKIHDRISPTSAAVLIVSAALLMSVVAFASTYLMGKQLPTEQTLKSSVGNEKFNTLRFETYGGQPENRLIGYFLYKEGIRVKSDGPQLEPVGKLSLNEVFADHARVAKAKFYSKSGKLMIREIIRENSVIGYAVSDPMMEITLWDATTDPLNISLELRYKDLQAKGDRYYGGPR
jgi:hypothetical protein